MKITDSRLRLSASDVANYLACQHLSRLDLQMAQGTLRPPREFDIGFQDLVRRGEAHERTVLDQFRADGRVVADISATADAETAKTTAEALRAGVELIYQGTLTGSEPGHGPALLGRPDFLVRADLLPAPDGAPRPGGVHYEVVDAKLARSAKARAVLQTAFYSYLLAGLQGVEPRWMHLALGHGEFASFKVSDYAAYERQTRRRLEAVIAASLGEHPPAVPYPEPVEHCAICRWSDLCAERRRRDARSASPVRRMPSSATSSTPSTSTRGGAEPGRPESASARIATIRTCMRTPPGCITTRWNERCVTASWTWRPGPAGCGRAGRSRTASTPCSSTRRGRCRWQECWRWPARPGTWSCWATPGGHLLDGDLFGRRSAPWAGLPLRRAPPERGHLTSPGPGDHRGQPGPDPRVLPNPSPDGPSERPVPGLGIARVWVTPASGVSAETPARPASATPSPDAP